MLRVLKLSHSENLIKTPDFTKVPNLEVLDLEGCTRLREIHQSLLRHNKLILLNLKGCTSLTTLPGKIFMESLKTLVLSGCSKSVMCNFLKALNTSLTSCGYLIGIGILWNLCHQICNWIKLLILKCATTALKNYGRESK